MTNVLMQVITADTVPHEHAYADLLTFILISVNCLAGGFFSFGFFFSGITKGYVLHSDLT